MQKSAKIIYIALALIFVVILVTKFSTSKYTLFPQDLSIKGKGDATSSIFGLKYDTSCVPGPQDTAASYTKSLTPGGFCGDQQWVAQQADYEITDGIGSSLLS
jgi:hypothetical protein